MNVNSILKITNFMIIGLLAFLTACSPPVVIQPTSEAPSPIAVPTIAVNSTLVPTSLPIIKSTVLPTFSPTVTSALAVGGCQDSAQYISDDELDGTSYTPNIAFTKTWKLKNTGSCTWDSGYLVSFISGTTMSQQPGYWIVQQGQTVASGQTVDVSVGMTPPVDNGNYVSYWGLKKGDRAFMPIAGGAICTLF